MARNGSKSPLFHDVTELAIPILIGLGAIGIAYVVISRSGKPAAPNREVFRAGGFGPQNETWAPFVNTLTAGQTFKAYKGEADIGYSALAAPDLGRGLIRARNLQTNQEEAVPLYTINRLGTG